MSSPTPCTRSDLSVPGRAQARCPQAKCFGAAEPSLSTPSSDWKSHPEKQGHGLLGPHSSHDPSQPPHTRPLDMAAQSLPEVCQSGSPWKWSCGHRPPLVTGSEIHKGLYTSHSADYSVSGPLSLLEPHYGFFQFVPPSCSVGKVVQKFIIIPIFLMRKPRLREGAGLTRGHAACYWWC